MGHYKFFYYMTDENPINRPPKAFATLDGITKQYQIADKNEGIVYWRNHARWCLLCTDSLFK